MMRAAIYWAPEVSDPLHGLGSRWLGRDAETAASLTQPDVPGIAEITADARGYGLHATLKPPFRLARPYGALREAVAGLAAATRPFSLPPLSVQDLKGFLALRESAPDARLEIPPPGSASSPGAKRSSAASGQLRANASRPSSPTAASLSAGPPRASHS
jgi:hypothetical protein